MYLNDYSVVASNGVHAGNGLFVGFAFYGPNNAITVAQLDVNNKACTITDGAKNVSMRMTSCVYLKNEYNKYEWRTRKQNIPLNLSNAVKVYGPYHMVIARGTRSVLAVNKVAVVGSQEME
jgi:hypothetical protein